MALSETQKKRIRVYEYLIVRLDRKCDQFEVEDFFKQEKRTRYYLLLIKIKNLKYKIKKLKNGDPENGYSIEFETTVNE